MIYITLCRDCKCFLYFFLIIVHFLLYHFLNIAYMALISITISESESQRISGIPETVTLTTNIPSTIFYTLDGTDPDTSSLVYIGSLRLPTNQPSVTLKLFATNGVDSSAIIERHFRPNIILGRQKNDRVILNDDGKVTTFPYGTHGPGPAGPWTSIGPDKLIVDKPDVENIPGGFDGSGTGTTTAGTDLPITDYLIRYSDKDRARGHGIGTLPAKVTVAPKVDDPAFSDRNKKMFNPRALVIYQDSREEPEDPNIVNINRQFFSLQHPETVKDGILYNTTGFEGNIPTGSLLRSHFNPRENTLTYYYFDSQALRWIISIEPFTPASPKVSGLHRMVFANRNKGDSKVFRWIPFKGSHLI
jgi:hypothetical protein